MAYHTKAHFQIIAGCMIIVMQDLRPPFNTVRNLAPQLEPGFAPRLAAPPDLNSYSRFELFSPA